MNLLKRSWVFIRGVFCGFLVILKIFKKGLGGTRK